MMNCEHLPVVIDVRRFTVSVAVHPHTDENPSAHGGITKTQECVRCGARRDVNVNQNHIEHGVWGPARDEREAQERRETEQKRADHERRCRQAAIDAGVKIVGVNSDNSVNISVKGTAPRVLTLDEIRQAAEKFDAGDELTSSYKGMLLMAESAIKQRRDEEQRRGR